MRPRNDALALLLAALLAGPVAAEELARWLGVSASNAQAELTVFDVARAPATAGMLTLTVATGWRNTVPPERMSDIEWITEGLGGLAQFGQARPPTGRAIWRQTEYLVPELSRHLFLAHGVGGLARLPAETGEIRLPQFDDEVEHIAEFTIPEPDAEAMTLLFLDFVGGHIEVPLTANPPDREGSDALAEAANEMLRARVYAASAARREVTVDLGLLSQAAGAALETDLGAALRLIRADGQALRPRKADPSWWLEGAALVLPVWEQRARLVFVTDARAAEAALDGLLEITLPGMEPLRLPLRPGAALPKTPAAAATPVMATWTDGEDLWLDLVGLGIAADGRGVTLAIRVRNRAGYDLAFAPAAQFRLVADGRAVPDPAFGRNGDEVWEVPDGATRELELRYVLRRAPARAELHYAGFEEDTVLPLEVDQR